MKSGKSTGRQTKYSKKPKKKFNTIAYWITQPLKNAYNNIINHAKILKKIATNTQKNAIRKESIKLNIKYKKNSRKVSVSSIKCWYINVPK